MRPRNAACETPLPQAAVHNAAPRVRAIRRSSANQIKFLSLSCFVFSFPSSPPAAFLRRFFLCRSRADDHRCDTSCPFHAGSFCADHAQTIRTVTCYHSFPNISASFSRIGTLLHTLRIAGQRGAMKNPGSRCWLPGFYPVFYSTGTVHPY